MRFSTPRSRSGSHRTLALLSAALLVPGTLALTALPASAAPGHWVKIDSTRPNWLPTVTPNTRQLNTVAKPSAGKRMDIRVYLAPKGGQQALEDKVMSLSDPSSADYGKWLSTAQYRAAYEPTSSSVASVRSYLKSQGLTVTGVEAQHRYLSATGSVAQLQKAFNITLGNYRHDGQSVVAPSSAASVPSSIASSVLTVSGLDTTQTKVTHNHTAPSPAAPPAGFANARPCSLSYGQVKATYQADYKTPLPTFDGRTLSYSPCGYTGPQLRAAYENNSTLDGSGVTVGIVDAYAWGRLASDASTYAVNHGDGDYAPGQLTQSLPAAGFNRQGTCVPSGWAGEEMLDVEATHAMAPGANIRYYASSSCFDDDLLSTLGRVVDENAVKVVSNSYGDVESNASSDSVVAYEQVFLQGAAQGISFMFSSGDNGDELANTGVKQVDYPTSDPYVTSVGGTSTGIAADGSRSFDTGWGTDKYTLSADGKSWTPVGYLYGAGGGNSSLFNRPSYQNGIVPSSYTGRAVPDVAMDADPNTGMLIGITQQFTDGTRYGEYRIGGTSLASPLFAGMTALALQQQGNTGYGLLNPAIYAASKTVTTDVGRPKPSIPGDVRADYKNGENATGGILYSVRTFGQDSSLPVGKGWDPVTGVGVPNTSYFKLAAAATSAAQAAARR